MRKLTIALVLARLAGTLALAQAEKPLLLQSPTLSGTQIAFAHGGSLWIVGRDGGEARRLIVGDPGAASGPVFSPDGTLLALHATDRLIRLVDPRGGEELARLTSPDTSILKTLRFSPDGRWLAAAAGSNVRLWDLRTLRTELAGLSLNW